MTTNPYPRCNGGRPGDVCFRCTWRMGRTVKHDWLEFAQARHAQGRDLEGRPLEYDLAPLEPRPPRVHLVTR